MRFSVIIPAYNVAEYLPRAVDSVLQQNFGDWEAILVDDGSSDGKTGALCDALAAKGNIRVIHQENGGLGAARNTGLAAAQGDYILFLDSDDHFADQTMATLNARIEATHCDIYTFGFAVERGGAVREIVTDDLPAQKVFTLQDTPRLLLSTPNAWNRAYRREFFLQSSVRYPGRVWFEDIRTTMKLFALAQSVETVPVPLYFYTVRDGSIMRNSDIARNGEIIEAFDDLLAFYRERGLYERYEAELCRLAIDHLYLAASVRVLRADAHHPLLGELAAYMETHFPDYANNPYRRELPRMRALAFSLLQRKQYALLRLLFRIKGA